MVDLEHGGRLGVAEGHVVVEQHVEQVEHKTVGGKASSRSSGNAGHVGRLCVVGPLLALGIVGAHTRAQPAQPGGSDVRVRALSQQMVVEERGYFAGCERLGAPHRLLFHLDVALAHLRRPLEVLVVLDGVRATMWQWQHVGREELTDECALLPVATCFQWPLSRAKRGVYEQILHKRRACEELDEVHEAPVGARVVVAVGH